MSEKIESIIINGKEYIENRIKCAFCLKNNRLICLPCHSEIEKRAKIEEMERIKKKLCKCEKIRKVSGRNEIVCRTCRLLEGEE